MGDLRCHTESIRLVWFACLLIGTVTGAMSRHLVGWLAVLLAVGTLLVIGIAALTLDD
jgi:hypothetical protein